MKKGLKIAFVFESFSGGGVQRVVLSLARALANMGKEVILVVWSSRGPFFEEAKQSFKIVDLKVNRALTSIPGIVRFIKNEKPDLLISNFLPHGHSACILAGILAGGKTRIILVNHTHLTESRRYLRKLQGESLPRIIKVSLLSHLFRFLLTRASAIVAVSEDVASDFSRKFNIPKREIKVIYNPIDMDEIRLKSKEGVEHPWFRQTGVKVIISVGRLVKSKDYSTLLRAFAVVRERIPCKLVILGEGPERERLENLARNLGIADDVWIPGFVDNPYKYISRCSVFVLSSLFEGFPLALVEALACGVPVVSTNCKAGPREILDEGKYGRLVEKGSYEEMAEAILESMKTDFDRDILMKRAREFSLERALNGYLKLFEE